MNNNSTIEQSQFKKNLKEAIKTFVFLLIFIFTIILGFYVLGVIFPTNVIMEPEAFVFAYIMAMPFIITLSLYPFGKK